PKSVTWNFSGRTLPLQRESRNGCWRHIWVSHPRPSAESGRNSRENRPASTRSLCDFCRRGIHWRQMSKLPQSTEVIACGPTLNDLASVESKHLHRRGSDGSPRWRLSHKTPGIGGGSGIPAYHQVALRDDFLHLDPEIGQHRSQHRDDSLNIFWAS